MTERELDRLAAAGVYGPSEDDAAEQRALLDALVAQGVSVDELAATSRMGGLVLRAFEHRLQPGDRLTLQEVAASSDLAPDVVLEVRRAWGFPDPLPEERCFVAADLDMLLFARSLAGFFGRDLAMHFVRLLGSAMSRVAEAEVALLRSQLEAPMEQQGASTASVLLRYARILEISLPAILRSLDALHRGHLVHAGRRYTGSAPPSAHNVVDLVVGFADLTQSTALVRRLDLAGLDHALTTFEELTTDLIAGAGATLVKRLGDGVMFVTARADVACRLALDLVGALRDHPAAPPAKVGLAAGEVAALRGDFFGPAVHLAARIVAVAPPAIVLAPRGLRDRVPGAVFRSAGLHSLAGFGDPVELVELLADGRDPVPTAQGD